MLQQAILEGKALWSAKRVRKESEERLKALHNRIKKLENTQIKFNRSLINVANKSQQIIACRKSHYNVIFYLNSQFLQEKERLKTTQRIQQLEKSQRQLQDKIKHIQRKEQINEELVTERKQTAKKLKASINEGLNRSRKLEKEKREQVKQRKVQDKLNKTLNSEMHRRSKSKKAIRQKLEKERESSQANLKTWRELKEKEMELMTTLKNTFNESMEVIKYVKRTSCFPMNYEAMIKTLLDNEEISYN